jgi:hypothetical protein
MRCLLFSFRDANANERLVCDTLFAFANGNFKDER